jgi:PAS domain S-box-containing protein
MSVLKLTRALALALMLPPLALLALCVFYAGGLNIAVGAAGAAAFALQAAAYLILSKKVARPLGELAAASTGQVPFLSGRSFPSEIESIKSYVLSAGALLDEYREQYRDLLMSIPDILLELDKSGSVLFVNRAALDIMGYSEDEVLGKPFTQIMETEWRPRWLHALSMLQDGEQAGNIDLKITLAGGGASFFEFNAVPIWKSGLVAGCCCVGRDIEERRKIITELEAARRHAEEASLKLKKTVNDLEEFSLLAVRRELKMQELREMFVRLKEEHEINKEFPG